MHGDRQGLQQLLREATALRRGALARVLFLDVDGDAARVHELAALEASTGADLHLAHPAVTADQPRRPLVHRFAGAHPREQRAQIVVVGIEIGQVVAHILVAAIAQQVQLGLVGTQDRAVGRDQPHAHRGMFEKILRVAHPLPVAAVPGRMGW